MTINYLIIDDEPIAHKLIEKFANELDYMHLCGNCFTALEAVPMLSEKQIDLIFLDLNMPKLKGFSFLQSLQNPPLVIVISAHQEYAIEGYNYDILDYLLKPFNFERFFKAVQKAANVLAKRGASVSLAEEKQYVFIKDEKKQHKINLSEIIYIEASGNYAIVYLEKSKIISQMKISDFENLLPKKSFVRVHRSFMLSKNYITLVKANEVHLGNVIIPIGRVYKENMDELLK
jgi:DNA-binding LytR/AlgR family response regulator